MAITSNNLYFFISYGISFIACTLIAKWYLWPAMITRDPKTALTPLLLYACLRVNGLMSARCLPRLVRTQKANRA